MRDGAPLPGQDRAVPSLGQPGADPGAGAALRRTKPVHRLLAEIPIEASRLSQQLGILRGAGLVAARRDGNTVEYSLSTSEVAELTVTHTDPARARAAQQTLRAVGGLPVVTD